MSLDEFLEYAQDNPIAVSDAVNYLLEAIEYFGTRTVFEKGEEKERYRFFDDPYGNGEHAILGNTDTLNEFVEELRRRASEEGDNEKIIWFLGPTATGKSELKRCIINGIRGFSRSEEGAKWTLEWTLSGGDSESRMSYGDSESISKDWYKSPINVNPLSILPEESRSAFLDDIDADYDIDSDLDPFSRESLDILEEKYDSFEDIVNSGSVRVTQIEPEVGDGIGVLHSEDDGNPKQRLVGSWMEGAMEKFAKRGQMNPQAFSYDGVLSQGNGSVSIIEDAGHHSDVLDKMLNVCEEEMVKLDNKISMDLDTLIFAFSNPDLEGQLEEYEEAGHADPLRALRRRLDKYNFGYLVTLSTEALLMKRLLQDESFLWEDIDDRMEKVAEPLELYGAEVAPRTIEAATMYEITTRLTHTDINSIENALLLEHREIENNIGNIVHIDELTEGRDYHVKGKGGIPVTFTIDCIVDLCQENEHVLPEDIIQEMKSNLHSEPLFTDEEEKNFQENAFEVKDYIFDKQKEDVLEAMVGDVEVTEEDVQDYVDSVLAWQDDEDEEYDSYELKEFETRYLGLDDEMYGTSAVAQPPAVEFRKEIISPINRYMWEQRDEEFTATDVPISESPSLQPLLEENDWDMVARIYPDADPDQWENPPDNTQTKELKEKTVKRLVEMFDYTEESAERVSKRIVENTSKLSEVL
jgi:predicted Ser/Thr protein kinase